MSNYIVSYIWGSHSSPPTSKTDLSAKKLFYLPFYFQSVRGDSAIKSGVQYIPLALSQLVGIMVSGGLTTRFGYYVRAMISHIHAMATDEVFQLPFIIVGQIICAVGTGLLTTIGLSTSTAIWATFLVLIGFGLGMGINAPHIAIQAVFER